MQEKASTKAERMANVVKVADSEDERLVGRNLAGRIVTRYGERFRDFFNVLMGPYFLIEDKPVFDPKDFAWTEEIKANLPTIEKELRALMKDQAAVVKFSEFSIEQTTIDTNTSWGVFFMYSFGYRLDRNCAQCPQTVALVSKIPNMMSALFSVHKAGTHLARHVGVTKAMITVHLPIIIPKKNPELCRIDVAGAVYQWRKGEWFIFDDTYDHEVWNDTEEDRINLMLHIRRPMRGFGRVLSDLFFAIARRSAYIQDPLKKYVEYDKRDSDLPVYSYIGIPKA